MANSEEINQKYLDQTDLAKKEKVFGSPTIYLPK